jgi:hypothetical protein
LESWDSSIERRAGGLDHTLTMESQELATTNLSSLYALAATLVELYFKGELPETSETSLAAKRIRVLLFLNAGVAEIGLLNSAENIEQHERKRHTEIDNIISVQVGPPQKTSALQGAT